MIKRRFTYHCPASIDEAIAAVAEVGSDAEIVGGGTWVVPEMTHGTRNPGAVVDLRNAGLAGASKSKGGLSVGAMTTYAELASSKLVQQRAGALATMAAGITGGAQVRYQGTLGGSACYATPSSDAPGALVGLGATMRLRSSSGTRAVDASEFFTGAFESDVEEGEVLEAITLPAPPENARFGHYKLKLVESSWPIATATCVVGLDEGGVSHLCSTRRGRRQHDAVPRRRLWPRRQRARWRRRGLCGRDDACRCDRPIQRRSGQR